MHVTVGEWLQKNPEKVLIRSGYKFSRVFALIKLLGKVLKEMQVKAPPTTTTTPQKKAALDQRLPEENLPRCCLIDGNHPRSGEAK